MNKLLELKIIKAICCFGSFFFFTTQLVYAQQNQSLTIESCYELAKENYPLVKQYALIKKSEAYSIANANKGYLPRLNIGGQATYQSEVTELPFSLPNMNIPEMSKDQYKLYGEVVQPITDLFNIKNQKELIKTKSVIDEQKVEVELYKLKERINQLYFAILLIDAQLQQMELFKKDIQIGIDKITAAIANGVALKSSADVLKAELLKVRQKTIELNSNRKGFVDMLSLFINQPIEETTVLETPITQTVSSTINRSELKLFEIQKRTFDIQNKLITANNLPKVLLFFQGGIGRPALNMLSNDINGYYIGGIRLNWNISGFYTYNKEKQLLSLNQKMLDVQKDVFLFNTNLALKQQNSELTKIEELISVDNEIIELREQIKNTTKHQLENGVATSNDYLNQVNAADQAKQSQLLHQIQLLMTQYNYQTTSGN